MHIKQFITLGLSALLFGCIGENSDANKATTSTTPATTTPTVTTPKAATPGTIGTEPAIYKLRTAPNRQLQTYFQGYVKDNLPLDKRDEDATNSHLSDILSALPLWSADTTKWVDQFDTPTGTPPDSVNIRIVNDKGGSVIAADVTHLVQNLQMDTDTGLFIPAEKTVLATKVTLDQASWIDIRGKMGSASFDMKHNSIVDVTNGYGLLLDSKLTDLKYDANLDPTGVLTLMPNGEMRIDQGAITLHKADIQGSLGVSNATFNFQTRRDNKTDNIVFLQTKGKVYPLDSDTFPGVMMTVNGPFQFKPGSEIEMFLTTDKISKIVLLYPFSDDSTNKPVIEGKIRFIPKGVESLTNTTGQGLLLIDSDIGFSANMDLSQLIADNTVLKKKLSLVKAAITDPKHSKREGIFLKIENTSSLALKATVPMQSAITSLKQGEVKAALWNTVPSHAQVGNIVATEFFTTQSTHTTAETSAVSQLFGLKHTLDCAQGNLVMTQTFNRTQLSDYVYRFIPKSHEAFWMVQHTVKFNTPFNLGNMTLTPAAGISHFMVAETAFQSGFQTLNPDISLTCGITHISDTSKLSMNIITTALYSKGTMELSDHAWIINSGFNLCLQTPQCTIATGLLNPFQSSSEMYVNIQTDF
ncbi:hypothetical protein [Candidatus Bodocaedibacter vickermanii]|uniref:Uncharacterized protein n=1 Tax=Candidatus Bodocaedibacter vickermanii TaxID=2741701 RepID=A0A7L9RV16_9PROT|nr:hypothetical protein CPBP_01064 [Candidatus Paracaedibacteraceae bacterium 'Lake Konstanz']